MILYLDASARVKRDVQEKGLEDVNAWIEAADLVVTGLISRVEVAAAIARPALRQFRSEWGGLHRLPITGTTAARGDTLAVENNLRFYDANHLFGALIWQETLGMPVTLASFARQLIEAAMLFQMCAPPA